MSVDNADHRYGGRSREYVEQTRKLDASLARFAHDWTTRFPQGTIIIGSDHGMTDTGHGGVSLDALEVFYFASSGTPPSGWPAQQKGIRGLIEEMLLP